MKTTLLADWSSGAIFDVHCSTKKPHDTQVATQVLTRNLDQVSTITPQEGDVSDQLRRFLQAHGVESVVKHLEVTGIDWAQNRFQDEDEYQPADRITNRLSGPQTTVRGRAVGA